ncbi:MAG: EF2563 family selenium-dependent molybdenum hydroxylase system protein [Dehalococcoidia bacterium]|nr:MAG: EF2563 family selenium-dependent molybdenum hydroxylase system protein [Dehalococcoidia bacterium]
MNNTNIQVCIRGAGELATAVAHKLHKCNFRVFLTEIANPKAVRRKVAFCEAVHLGSIEVEGVTAELVVTTNEINAVWQRGNIPLIIGPKISIIGNAKVDVFIDAIMAKKNTGVYKNLAPLVIGLGPGFSAGRDVDVVIETKRGHDLGRIILEGEAEPNTGIPGVIGGYSKERVFRAPQEGTFKNVKDIGDIVEAGETLAIVDGIPVKAEISGVIRGMLANGTNVHVGMKAGDIDPRGIKRYCYTISDKGRTIAGGVVEAILSWNKLYE